MQKNATQSTVVRVNNKRKYAHQMHANARKRVFEHAFFNMRLRKSCACVLRVRWPLISDLYCMSSEACGVQERIRRIAPMALYTHCNNHVLNLSVAAACRLTSVRNMTGTLKCI